MRKFILVFAASLLGLGAWAQDEYLSMERTFDLTCTYPEDWNDMTEEHMFYVYGTYAHPYNRSGSIEYRIDYSNEWMELTFGMLQPDDEIMAQISVTLDSTETWHTFQFRIIDEANETVYIEPYEFVGIQEYHFYGIEDKVYTGEALTQDNIESYYLYSSNQFQIVNYRNNTEVGTAYFDVIGVYPYSIGKCTLSFQIFDANNPEWALLLELRTALANQGNEEWVDWYWPTTNGIASAANWYGVTMSEGHVTELDLSIYDLQLDSIPQAAFRFPNLTHLDASGKELTGNIEHIVDSTDIPCAASLVQLDLSTNRFTGNVGALAHLFPNLTYLNVTGNRITEVNPMISPMVTDLWTYNQEIDSVYTFDFSAPLTKERMMATLPTILLYNHYEQAYVKDISFTFQREVEYGAWYMNLYAGVDSEYYGTEFQVATWQEDPAYRYRNGDTLYVQGEGTFRAKVLFKPCDADFNGTVDIADLQTMLNYIFGWMDYAAVINFTATDLYPDSIMNVQDIVRMVDTLLTHEVPVVFEVPHRAATTETADAALYWLNGDLHLRSNRAVASMQIEIATAGAVTWVLNSEWLTGERLTGEGTKVVLYSLSGATIPAETDVVIAHCSDEATVRAAALSDPAAKRISVRLNSPAVTTDVESIQKSVFSSQKILRNGKLYILYKGAMYDVQGRRVKDKMTK